MKRDITDKFLYADRSGKPDGIVSIFVKLTFAAAVFFISSTVNAEFSYSVPAVADNDCMIQEIQTPDSFDTQDIFNTAPTIRDRALKRNNTRRQNKTYLFTAPADFFPTESIFSPKKSAVCYFLQNFNYTTSQHKYTFFVRAGPVEDVYFIS